MHLCHHHHLTFVMAAEQLDAHAHRPRVDREGHEADLRCYDRRLQRPIYRRCRVRVAREQLQPHELVKVIDAADGRLGFGQRERKTRANWRAEAPPTFVPNGPLSCEQ